jgi:glycosyltransferase involved in cell wall biosynthesis
MSYAPCTPDQRICFVGMENLPALAPEYEAHAIGGEQVQHTLLARALRRRGFDVSMIVGDYGQADGASWDGIRTFKAYRRSAGAPVIRFVHPRWTGLHAAARRADAGIYYVSCAGAAVGQLVSFARSRGSSVVFRIASDSDCQPDRLLIARDRFGVRHRLHKAFYAYGLRNANAILAQSLSQQAALRTNYGLASTVLPMLVEGPAAPLTGARDVPVLWAANIRMVKRPDRALELARALPDIGMHMVGGPLAGHEALYSRIQTEAGALPNVHFHGRLSYRKTNSFFDRARVHVNTSEVEGFPNTFLQAWVRGVPVVSFLDPDGVIARERLGFHVRDLGEMQAAVRSLADGGPLWRETSERCLRYMRTHYDTDRILDQYLAAFPGPSGAAAVA